MIGNVAQVFDAYIGTTMFLSVFIVCLIYGFCHADEKGKKRLVFIAVFSILFIFNDLSWWLMGKLTEIETYYRFIWALPLLPMIAWAGTKAITERRKFWERAVVVILLIALFQGGTSTFVTEGSIRVPENEYNLPGDLLEVCEIIKRDKKKEQPVVIFDLEYQLGARLYDPSIIWGISRKAYQYHNNPDGYENVPKKYRAEKSMIRAVNFGMKDDIERLNRALKKRGVDYIVAPSAYEMEGYFAQAGYGLVDMTQTRNVYARIDDYKEDVQ